MKVYEWEEMLRKEGLREGLREGRQEERKNTERERIRADKAEKEVEELKRKLSELRLLGIGNE